MLIGLVGKARSGKDTVANHLAKTHGFRRVAFADKLKEVCMELLDLSQDQCYGDLKEVEDPRYGKTPRWILQYIGTDVFRQIRPNIWVDLVVDRYETLIHGFHGLAVSDVRFPNEVEAIKLKGGFIWKTERTDHGGASGGIEGHASETSLDGLPDSAFDLVLSAGSGQIQRLYTQADQGVSGILGRSRR
jgi:hypothetical protein